MVDKAVVLAAGEGSRLEPITHAIPKEIIRVGRRPTIEHALRVLKEGGIEEILVVVGRNKQPIVDYLGSGERFDLEIYFRVQEEPEGTAPAVSLAKGFIDDEDFAVMYGDNYMTPYNVMEEIVKFHEEKDGNGTIVLHRVEDPRRYGIVELGEGNEIQRLLEKPSLEEAAPLKHGEYWLNIAGLMILNPKVFDHMDDLQPGEGGEIWLTDAVEKMRRTDGEIYGYVFEGKRYDIGTFDSLREADELALDDSSRGKSSKNR